MVLQREPTQPTAIRLAMEAQILAVVAVVRGVQIIGVQEVPELSLLLSPFKQI
jgi:hypothetical protein